MLLSLKKKNGNQPQGTEEPAELPSVSPFVEFIPYYCHYNPHTLLTKNGEVMQIIKLAQNLSGLDYESGSAAGAIAREKIRRAIVETVDTDKVSFWLHTVRKRRPIHYTGTFSEPFAAGVHERWEQIHRWKYQYYNEIYISLLYEGQGARLTDAPNFRNVFMPRRNRDFRNAYIDLAYEELDRIALAMVARIREQFDARRLTVVERVPPPEEMKLGQAIYYSEPMEFLGTLLNLRSEQFPLPETNISQALCTSVPSFGFNAVETRNEAGKRRFGALLTLKQYREVPPETVDRLLQAPMEFIISQSFHFIRHAGALKQYKEQKDLFMMSGDEYCIRASGIEDMMASHGERSTDFGEHQTSVMVLADEFKQLESEIAKVHNAFNDLGLITIREDVKLEECFWSQLPGNFEFIRRRDTINTIRVGGFCRLNRFPNGAAAGNHWGDAVTLLPTQVGSPYFFNFHHQDNGHTAVFDFNSFNDQVCPILVNFLLTETRKYKARTFVFDRNQSASLLFGKLGGHYHHFAAPGQPRELPKLRLNPFRLEDTPRNKGFIAAWCASLIQPDLKLDDGTKALLKDAIDRIYAMPPEDRRLPTLVRLVRENDAPLAQRFDPWHGEGKYSGLVDGAGEDVSLQDSLHAFDMTPFVKHPHCMVPVFAYLMHRIVTGVDGRPCIILLNEAWDLLENPFIAPRLESLMEMLQQNNAIMILTASKPLNCVDTHTFRAVMKHCATHIHIPDDIGRHYVNPAFGISETDSRLLLKMDRQKGDFLLKQNNETIALRADVKELDDHHAVLANDSKNLAAALGKFAAEKKKKDH